MLTLKFNDLNDLIGFLNFNSDMGIWETPIFRLSASHGIEMNISTKVNDPLGLINYLQFDSLKQTMNNFAEHNSHLDVNLEIKLKFPDANRKVMDPDNYYGALYLNCYSNSTKTFAATSYMESSKDLPPEPITAWCVYISGLYNDYQNSKN